jgi:serine/threonine protein kinase
MDREVVQLLYPEYQVLVHIAGGAYGQVWLASHSDGTLRAIKFVEIGHGDPDRRYERERRGVRLLKSLSGMPDGIVTIHDIREKEGAGFAYMMDLADPERTFERDHPEDYRPRTLQSEITARRALSLSDSLDIGIRLAEALDFLQRYRLVHRDIKPSNVMFIGNKPVLADLGLLADTREAASIVGTPGYVPEEQHGSFCGDIFSLGVLLTEISTGRPAEEAGYSPVEEADTESPGFAEWLSILRRACASKADKRYQTAATFLRDLKTLRDKRANKSILPPWGLKWAAAVLLVAGSGWLIWSHFKSDPPEAIALPEVPDVAIPDTPATRPSTPARERAPSTITVVDRRGDWIDSVDRSPLDRAHAATRLHFHVPSEFTDANGFLHAYEDVVLIYTEDEADWRDWRMVFYYRPLVDGRAQPLLVSGPPSPIMPDEIPVKRPLRAWPPDAMNSTDTPQFVFQIPPVILDNPPPHNFPVWIFICTTQPAQVEQWVSAYFEDNPDFRNPQPFYFFQNVWIDLHGLRYVEP